MERIPVIALLVMIVGLLVYYIARPDAAKPNNGLHQRIGEHMFWTGLLVLLMTTANYRI